MFNLARTDRSILAHWWWTIDKWILLTVFLLIGVGAILIMAASPSVADKIDDLDSFHFVRRQLLFCGPAIILLISVSLMNPLLIRRLGVILFFAFFILTIFTIMFGPNVNGAHRWLFIGGMQIQPSEFIKPSMAIFIAWMLSEKNYDENFPGYKISFLTVFLVLLILFLQPDIGMALVVGAFWFVQMFVAGLSLYLITALALIGMVVGIASYFIFQHVQQRVDRFLDSSTGDSYQVDTALNAFDNGGLFGTGPGEGVVKAILPDAHADFIFAVAGEEFGLIAVLVIIFLFSFVVLRGFSKILNEKDSFVLLACTGILTQLGLQAVINMGVNMRLLPAKGMTLPFISYGGSSLLALAFAMGVVIALTRKRVGLRLIDPFGRESSRKFSREIL